MFFLNMKLERERERERLLLLNLVLINTLFQSRPAIAAMHGPHSLVRFR